MASETSNEGSEELKKLNPEANDFVPLNPRRETTEVFKAEDTSTTPTSYKSFSSYAPTSYKSFSTKGSGVGDQTDPIDFALAPNKSRAPADAGQDKNNAAPVYGNALTWKSPDVKLKEEYTRVSRNVRTMAPEQFKDQAHPTGEPADIFPRTLKDYKFFKGESSADQFKELTAEMKDLEKQSEAHQNMKNDGIPQEKRVPKSYFGPGGKAFNDSRGTVLAQPTFWSQDHLDPSVPKASWPTHAERLEDGDSRENNQVQAHSGRHLPVPRTPQDLNQPNVSFRDRPAMPQYPLDQTGPIYRDSNGAQVGPSPAEIDAANEEMNNDPAFEAQALPLLGNDLMDEVGRWQPPKVPEWQARQRQEAAKQRQLAPQPPTAHGGPSFVQRMAKVGIFPPADLQQRMARLGIQVPDPYAAPASGGGNTQAANAPSYSGQQSSFSGGRSAVPTPGGGNSRALSTPSYAGQQSTLSGRPSAMPTAGGGNSQAASTPSYYGQQASMPSTQDSPHVGIRLTEGPAPRHYSFASSESSVLDMTGWTYMGRHVAAGSEIGESFWETPWGELVVYRDVW